MSSPIFNSIRALTKSWVPSKWSNISRTLDVGDLKGRPLLASSFPREPITVDKSQPVNFEDQNIAESFIYALHTICYHLHYRCMVQRAEYISSASDAQNGVLGDLSRQRAQIGIAGLTINSARFATFDMVISPFARSYDIVIDESNTYVDRSRSILSAIIGLYHTQVWILLAFILLVVFGTLIFLSFCRARLLLTSPFAFWSSLDVWLIRAIGSATNNCDVDEGLSKRRLKAQSVLLATWLLWLLVIINIFQSRLPMMLASGGLRFLPFNSIETLLESGYDIYGSRTVRTLFRADPTKLYQDFGARMKLIEASADTYPTVLLDLLKSGKTAVVIGSDSHFEMAKISCDMIIAIQNLLLKPVAGLVFLRGSPLKNLFQQKYSHLLQAGTILQYDHYYRFLSRESGDMRRCMPRTLPRTPPTTFRNTQLEDVTFLLIFHMVLSALTVLVLTGERAFFWWRRRSDKK